MRSGIFAPSDVSAEGDFQQNEGWVLDRVQQSKVSSAFPLYLHRSEDMLGSRRAGTGSDQR